MNSAQEDENFLPSDEEEDEFDEIEQDEVDGSGSDN